MATIDLNCDLGEDPLMHERDVALLAVVSSASVACGGHAGDAATMRALVQECKRRGRGIGAHPSYPDRAGFGRVEMDIPPTELQRTIRDQVASLREVAESLGATVSYVKPHGALYHAAMHKVDVAAAVTDAIEELDPGLAIVSQALPAGAPDEIASACGVRHIRIAREAFADRRYEPSGLLRSRTLPGALLEDPAEAAAQAVRLAREGNAQTICIHSDTPNSLEIARAVAAALGAAGFTLAPFSPNNRP